MAIITASEVAYSYETSHSDSREIGGEPMNIGIIGAGAIAQFLLQQVHHETCSHMRVTSVYVRDRAKYEMLQEKYDIELYTDLSSFLSSPIDVVVEAANVDAVKEMMPAVLQQKPMIVISVGALVDEQMVQCIQQSAYQVYLPSGAIGGLDLLQNAQILGQVERVALTTRKPAQSLIKDSIVTEARVIFTGTATQAIKKFPKNMNVSIVLALAGIGFDQTKVTIIADPHITKNIHCMEITGDFGEASFTIKNNALPQNPKTSYLAALSVLGTLTRMENTFTIGG